MGCGLAACGVGVGGGGGGFLYVWWSEEGFEGPVDGMAVVLVVGRVLFWWLEIGGSCMGGDVLLWG